MSKVIVLGFMGRMPIAGVIWQHIHYIVGLRRLGFEVWYVEDTSTCPYDPENRSVTVNDQYALQLLADLAERFGFAGKWVYRARYRNPITIYGCSEAEYSQLLNDADCAINVCGSHELHEEISKIKLLIYVESDPGVEQIRVDKGDLSTREYLGAHHYRFSFGENIGSNLFPVPLHGLSWLPTRQPIIIDYWFNEEFDQPLSSKDCFTSICNWSTAGSKDIEWRDSHYLWSKSLEFLRFVDSPLKSNSAFELVTDIKNDDERQLFLDNGWSLISPYELSCDWQAYHDYIATSFAEFTCAKDQYIRLNTGWFSDRSACYLAAGRPVITQDTGFTAHYGGSEGLFAFSMIEQIVDAVDMIRADYSRHSRAAHEIAVEYFEATKVLRSLLERAGVI